MIVPRVKTFDIKSNIELEFFYEKGAENTVALNLIRQYIQVSDYSQEKNQVIH